MESIDIFYWLSKALLDQDGGGHLVNINKIYSDGEKVIATDGKRSHIVHKELERGFYDRSGKSTRVKIDKFPDIKVLTDGKERQDINIESLELEYFHAVDMYCYKLNDEFSFSSKYIEDAFSVNDDYDLFIYESNMLEVSTELTTAYIMPMRRK